jgi:hypothetical protein
MRFFWDNICIQALQLLVPILKQVSFGNMNKNLGNCLFGVNLAKISIFWGKIMELFILKNWAKN